MLWIALHLPCLSLEAFAATQTADVRAGPIALIEQHRITAVNAAAAELGVRPDMKRATALALAPHLVLGQAQALRDQAAQAGVAHAALAFTPMVCFEAPHTVLLEVQASLRYFGGLRRLVERLQDDLRPLGHCTHLALASTPLAATLLARMNAIPGEGRALDDVPLAYLNAAREFSETLQAMALRDLHDLQALPRAGVARRFGQALLDELDRAYGSLPDPRQAIVLPETFDSRLELFARADTTDQVLHGASYLLERLLAWARAQHAQVRRFTLVMQHEARQRGTQSTPSHTALEIALAEPSNDAKHLLVLLRERLAQVQLAAPTLDLRLQCSDIARRAPPNQELFPTVQSEREGVLRLMERLQARLGHERVQQMVEVNEHRPQRLGRTEMAQIDQLIKSTNKQRFSGGKEKPSSPEEKKIPVRISRPAWMLEAPKPLTERDDQPVLDRHPLRLVCGPERIESGWWDGEGVARDYFIARTGEGALVWVFRERFPAATQRAAGWFLHGRFG